MNNDFNINHNNGALKKEIGFNDGQISTIKPMYDIGYIEDLGFHMLMCWDYHPTDNNQDIIYDFFMITDIENVKQTNLFKKENCFLLKKEDYPWLKKDSVVICSLKYQIKESDIKKGLYKIKHLKNNDGKQLEIMDANYAWIGELSLKIKTREEQATVLINPLTNKAEIVECGVNYLNNYKAVTGNHNNVKNNLDRNMELNRYKNIQKEMDLFFKKQKMNLKVGINKDR